MSRAPVSRPKPCLGRERGGNMLEGGNQPPPVYNHRSRWLSSLASCAARTRYSGRPLGTGYTLTGSKSPRELVRMARGLPSRESGHAVAEHARNDHPV